LWSALMSAWNAPIATYLGEHDKNFCWGGGTAIRRDCFDEVRVRDAWQGAVSDDFALTRSVRSAGYPIVFVPECLVPSPNQASSRGLFEFTTRQTIITRVYAPKLWITAGLAHLLYCSAVILGLILWLDGLTVSASSSFHFLILATIPAMLCAVRGLQRLAAVVEILPEWREKLLKDSWVWTVLAPVVPFIALYSTVIALFRRKITWRGQRYELISPGQTRVLGS
jgi:ceramide glucosyltransferase